jgi:hypothetical protein
MRKAARICVFLLAQNAIHAFISRRVSPPIFSSPLPLHNPRSERQSPRQFRPRLFRTHKNCCAAFAPIGQHLHPAPTGIAAASLNPPPASKQAKGEDGRQVAHGAKIQSKHIWTTMRSVVEDQPAIGVHHLHRAGALYPGVTTKWDWAGGVVEICAHGDCAVIGGHEVPMRWHAGTLGGSWPSWQCPRCGRGAYLLYPIGGHGLACRLCGRLAHATAYSRSPAPWQVRRLRRRLGADLQPFTPLPPRPARGGWAALAYDKIAAEIAACEAHALAALDGMNTALERRKKPYDGQHERQTRKRRRNNLA